MKREEENMETKNNLQVLRKQNSLTQEEFAKKMNVAPDYISMIERGVRSPGFSLAKKIADFFGTTIDDIFFNH